MTDDDVIIPVYGGSEETNTLKPSPVSSVNHTSVSPRSAGNVTLVSPIISHSRRVTSPGVRENAILASHGGLGNEEESLRSSQTPVEMVPGTNGHCVELVNLGAVSAQSRTGRPTVQEQNGHMNATSDTISRQNNTRRHSDAETIDTLRSTDRHTNRRSSQYNSNAEIEPRQADRRLPQTTHLIQDTVRPTVRRGDRHSVRQPSQTNAHNDTTPDRMRSHRHSVGSRSISSSRSRLRSARTMSTEEEEKDERYVVPALPMPLAILCCVLNFIVPGLGSMAASVGVLCCAKTEDMNFKEKCGSCCTVFGIGILQLLLVACFLIGWIWSCIWGITFIGMSKNYYHTDDDEQVEDLPVWERNLIGRTPLPAPQIVDNQPYPGIGYEDLRREYERRRRRRQEQQRRARSRLSDFIYPMRAPSNIGYHSPPPPYEEPTDQPSRRSLDMLAASREESRRREHTGRDDRTRVTQMPINEAFRPMNSMIQEEDHIT